MKPIIRLENLIGELGETQSTVRVRFCHRQPGLDAVTRQQFAHSGIKESVLPIILEHKQ